MNKKKQGFFSKLRDRYRVNVINPDNFEEISSFNASWLQLLMVLSLVFVLAFFLSIAILVYTPLNSYFSEASAAVIDEKTLLLSTRADSLEEELKVQTQYIENQLAILKGEDDKFAEDENKEIERPGKEVDEATLFYVSSEDSSLRKELESDVYSLSVPKNKTSEALHFYPPVNGIVNADFNPNTGHFAVDLISEKDAPIKATLDGTVIFAEFSSTTGNVIVVQHLNNYISVYKHNSVLLKQVGNFVHAGEPIAIIGNSGEMTTGPHLHFELWQNGRPIDPENFIVF
ncbi:peptidoglycan DD-metalloendopeptidase family protein [bacterium]|nr:peptidoglycan DD-metalloendopeptidase family protein [bacterium]